RIRFYQAIHYTLHNDRLSMPYPLLPADVFLSSNEGKQHTWKSRHSHPRNGWIALIVHSERRNATSSTSAISTHKPLSSRKMDGVRPVNPPSRGTRSSPRRNG